MELNTYGRSTTSSLMLGVGSVVRTVPAPLTPRGELSSRLEIEAAATARPGEGVAVEARP